MNRPSWDEYFIQIAALTSKRSNCIRRQVGCIIVNENRIISTGMNGTPSGILNCFEGGCQRCNNPNIKSGQDIEKCLCIHAEENALLFANYSDVRHATIYCTHFPCTTCIKKIIQGRIKRIVYLHEYEESYIENIGLLNQVNCDVIQYSISNLFETNTLGTDTETSTETGTSSNIRDESIKNSHGGGTRGGDH